MIELGVPFSDPVADGPTIQRSTQHALEQGVTLTDTLRMLSSFRRGSGAPVVLFTYLNPVHDYGVQRFIDDAVSAGANGVLLTDLPVGSDPELEQMFQESPLSFIRLAAPTTPLPRLLDIAYSAQGFLYYIAQMGVTGSRASTRAETLEEVAALRQRIAVPIAVGFGISTAQQAQQMAGVADGVVVGSALIDALDAGGKSAMTRLVRSMRDAIDHG
jgi:tryptophan synthase alpha chain